MLFAVAAALALAVRLAVRESNHRGEGAVDLAGAALLAGGLGCMMLAISHGNQWAWGSPRTLALLTASGLLAVAFWVRERTAAQPLIDPRVLASRSIWSANLAMLALGFSLLISFALVPLIGGYPKITGYGLGLSTTQIGLVLAPSGLATIIGGLLGGRMIARTGARAQATIGGACAAITYILLAVLPWSAATLALAMIPLGFGVGLAIGAITDLVVLASPPERTGATVALNTVIRMAAAALGAQVAIAILTSTHGQIPGLPAARGFTDAFVMAAIASLVTIAAVLLTPARAEDPAVTPGAWNWRARIPLASNTPELAHNTRPPSRRDLLRRLFNFGQVADVFSRPGGLVSPLMSVSAAHGLRAAHRLRWIVRGAMLRSAL